MPISGGRATPTVASPDTAAWVVPTWTGRSRSVIASRVTQRSAIAAPNPKPANATTAGHGAATITNTATSCPIDAAVNRERTEKDRRVAPSTVYVTMPPATTAPTSAVAAAAETPWVSSRSAMRKPRNGSSSTAINAQMAASRTTRVSPSTARATDHGVDPSG
jgi:hypothetical protein